MSEPLFDESKAWEQVEAEENPQLALARSELERREAAADEKAAESLAEIAADDPIAIAQAAADAELAAKEPKKDDPVSTLTGQLTALQQQLKDQSEAAAKRERDLNGRYGGLQRELEQVRQEATAARAAAVSVPQQQAIAAAAKTPEKWEAFKEEWKGSGLTEAVEEFVASQKTPAVDPTAVESLVAERLKAEREAFEARFAKQQEQIVHLTMNQAHPQWLATVKSPEFVAWRAAQPPAISNLGSSADPQDAIHMLDLFKQSTAAPAADKQEKRMRLENAVSHTRPEHQPRKQLTVADMTPQQLWAYEARLEAANASRPN